MPRHLVILGPPGSGKGTQAGILSERLGLTQIGAGALLRAEVERGTRLGEEIAGYLDAGRLVPLQALMTLIERAIAALPAEQGIIFDGVPRSRAQAEALEGVLDRYDRPLDVVIVLQVPDEVVRRRLLRRGRPDDTRDVIDERLHVYHTEIPPILEYYTQKTDCRLYEIDGVDTPDRVAERIIARLL